MKWLESIDAEVGKMSEVVRAPEALDIALAGAISLFGARMSNHEVGENIIGLRI